MLGCGFGISDASSAYGFLTDKLNNHVWSWSESVMKNNKNYYPKEWMSTSLFKKMCKKKLFVWML